MKDRQRHQHRAKLLILREDKDRFESMRSIQGNMAKFKKWSLLLSSLTALLFLWLVGAAIFWQLEKDSQEWSYFDAVYFCFVSLLSIGYGDFAPKTNAGRPFFVLWSLLAVPFMTILITSLSNTVVQSVRDWTDAIADFTLLAKDGVWHGLVRWVSNALTDHDAQPVIVQYGEPDSVELSELTEALPFPGNLHSQRSAAKRLEVDTEHLMVQKLLEAIKSVAGHVKNDASRTYDYQEWTSLIKLMRFTRSQPAEAEQGLVEWDWLDENGPVAASGNEPAWVLDRLIECMQLYIRGQIHIGDRLEGNDDARARC